MTDPISDMLTRIRNAAAVHKADVRIPFSKLKYAIAKVLSAEGFVGSVEKSSTGHGEIIVGLKYEGRTPVIRNIKRVSKPGLRNYAGAAEMPRVLSDRGIAIITTSQGVMTNKEARKRKLGGEVLCEVY